MLCGGYKVYPKSVANKDNLESKVCNTVFLKHNGILK